MPSGLTASRSRAVHLLVAVIAAALFLGVLRLLPSLKTASNAEIVVKCAVELVVAFAVLLGVLRLDPRPEALGLRPLRFATFGWGLACFLGSAVFSVAMIFAFSRFGITQNRETLVALVSRPVPIMLLIAATAGIAEEIIFRSVLISQIEAGIGMKWLAGAISLAIFAGAHASGWGAWQIVFAAGPGLVLTLFFLWKRDLWVCILGHFLTDAVGLLSAAASMAHHS